MTELDASAAGRTPPLADQVTAATSDRPSFWSPMGLLERGWLPDAMIRFGIRRLLRQRLSEERRDSEADQQQRVMTWIDTLRSSPVAVDTDAANAQHYEVPPGFYERVLGPRLKYSSGLWSDGARTLAEAEDAMLQLVAERAGIRDGMQILDLGCGWGSLSLWLAERFPNASIVGLSNSNSQREFILGRAADRGLHNVSVVTRDIRAFDGAEFEGQFDRICSIEMMEHVRNYPQLLRTVAGMMHADALFFVHIFTHRDYAYPYNDQGGQRGWMARHFFTGGQMPSDHLLLYFQDHVAVERHWRVDGTHYAKTANAWLANMDTHASALKPLFDETYRSDAGRMWTYWRVFFMACAELWGFRRGSEWFVSHYTFRRRG